MIFDFRKFVGWIAATVLPAVVCALYAVQPVAAETASPDYEQVLVRQFDWVLNCQMEVLDNYLNYEGSLARGLVIFKVTAERSPRILTPDHIPLPPVKYEELWYQNGRCVGSKRLNDLPLLPGWQGAIYFRAVGKESICDHTRETANAAVRLLTDVKLKSSILQGIFIPACAFGQVGSELGRYNFVPLEQASATGEQRLSLHLIEYPRGNDHYFFYEHLDR